MSTLVSVIHWTPFFWEQNRFGTLLPALVMWIRHPFHNFLAQTFFNSFLGMMAFFLGGQLFYPGRKGLLGSALAVCLSLIILSPFWTYHYFYIVTPYGLSMFLFLAAAWIFKFRLLPSRSLLCKPWTWASVSLLLLLAQWANVGLIPLVGLFLLIYAWGGRQYKWLAFLGAASFAFFLNYLFMRFMPYNEKAQTQFVPIAQYSRGLIQLTKNLAHEMWQEPQWMMGGLSVLVILLTANFFLRPWRFNHMKRILLPMCIPAVIFYFFVAGLKWLDMNLYSPRYVTLSLFLLTLSLGLCLVQLWPFDRCQRSLLILALLSLFFAVAPIASRYSFHSYASKRQAFEKKIGSYTEQVLQWNATFVMGDYWLVWPTIFHAKWKLHEQKRNPPLFGLTHRSFPTEQMWRPLLKQGVRFAVFKNKPDLIEKYMDLYKIGTCKEIARTEELILLEMVSPVHQ
ncbi:MAG: hypothetical protein V1746_04415 [bacterium]